MVDNHLHSTCVYETNHIRSTSSNIDPGGQWADDEDHLVVPKCQMFFA